jgi:hypothetical protein
MEIISAIGINKEPSLCLLINMAVLVITHTFWFTRSRSLFFVNRYFRRPDGYGISDRQRIPVGNLGPGNESQTG